LKLEAGVGRTELRLRYGDLASGCEGAGLVNVREVSVGGGWVARRHGVVAESRGFGAVDGRVAG